MGISALLTGMIYGFFLYRKPASIRRILLCVLTESILISVFLQTFWLTMLTGKAYLVLLPVRILQNLITIPVSVICIWLVAYRVVALIPKNIRFPEPSFLKRHASSSGKIEPHKKG